MGLSLAFVKDLVAIADSVHRWSLIGSWIAFAGSIISIVTSMLVSHYAFDRQIELVDQCIDHAKRGAKQPALENPYSAVISCLNIVAALLFLIAVTMTVFFVGANIL